MIMKSKRERETCHKDPEGSTDILNRLGKGKRIIGEIHSNKDKTRKNGEGKN